MHLAGLRMRPVETSAGSVITAETLFEFTQIGRVVTARYSGGPIVAGVLAGVLDGPALTFRYSQVNQAHEIQSGHSTCQMSMSSSGRLRLTERFDWDADAGSGVNVLEVVDDGHVTHGDVVFIDVG